MPSLQSLAAVLLFLSLVSADGTFTISSLAAYSSQRVCAQGCFFGGFWNLPYALACQSPYLDSCACRTDLASSASSILSSCINNACSSNTNDIVSAESIYSSYCANTGAPATVAATQTGSPVGANDKSSKTVTITATVITSNGAVTTSPIAPVTTVINQNDPNYNNVINISGSGNNKSAAAHWGEVSLM
jgi:hypothetical protein